MTFFLPPDASPARVRQFNDTRTYQIRVLHWLYALAKQRAKRDQTYQYYWNTTLHITDNISFWRSLYQQKTSLNLRSGELTRERRGV